METQESDFSIFEDSFAYKLWTKSLVSRIIYVSIPFIIVGAFILMLHKRGAFGSNIEYNFFEDYANSYHLFGTFIFNYFMRGSFINYYKNKLNAVTNNCTNNKRSVFAIIYITSFVIAHISLFFSGSAKDYGERVWVNHLNNFELVFYKLTVLYIWATTIQLFLIIIYYTYLLYNEAKSERLIINVGHIDGRCGLKGVFSAISSSVGYGIVLLLMIAIQIISDQRAKSHFGMEFEMNKYLYIIAMIAILISGVYFGIMIITYIVVNNITRIRIEREYNNGSGDQDRLISLYRSHFDARGVVTFILTVLFPSAIAAIQFSGLLSWL